MPNAVVIPAPVGGWNARDALEAMDPADAVTLDNWIPGNGVVVGRGGSHAILSALGHSVDTLLPYEGSLADILLAAYDGHIYAVANIAGAIDPPISLGSGFTSDVWQYGTFDDTIIMLNGADTPQAYAGLTMAPATFTTLPAPVNGTFTPGAGTLSSATYYYRVSAINPNGESLASTETSLAITGPAGVNVTWLPVTGATGYKVYGRTTGAEQLLGTVLATSAPAFLDDGSLTPAGALPTVNTTNVNPALLVDVVNFKGRAIYVEKLSQRIWYAAAGAYQGMLTKLDFSSVTQRGGVLTQAITWTRDSGDGVDDYAAFVFSTGEVLIYQGTDPSNVNQWSMTGRYFIGAPLGRRAHARFASTEVVLTRDGFQTLDEAIQNARTELVDSFGGKIFRAAKIAAQRFADNFGWQATYYPRGNLFLVNVPVSDSTFVQYVRNTNTGSWCRFTNWNARCLVLWRDRLYFGTGDGQIRLADTQAGDGIRQAYSDNGAPIPYVALTAYQKFGQPGLKSQITAARITANVFDSRAFSLAAFADYQVRPLPALASPRELVQGQWDQSPWDTDAWASPTTDPADSTPKVFLRPISIRTGFATALSVRYQSIVQNVSWYSTEFLFNQAGVI